MTLCLKWTADNLVIMSLRMTIAWVVNQNLSTRWTLPWHHTRRCIRTCRRR
jgi:hypothetical protein